jgi:hypothetical protein
MMEFLDKLMELVSWTQANGEMISVTLLAVIAGADKVALVLLKTLSNIRDAYRDYFGPKAD